MPPIIDFRDDALPMMLGLLNLGVTVMPMLTRRVCLRRDSTHCIVRCPSHREVLRPRQAAKAGEGGEVESGLDVDAPCSKM